MLDYINSFDVLIIEFRCMSQKPDSLTLSENTMYHQVVDQLNEAVQGIYPDLPFELINLSTKFKNASINDFIKALKHI